MVRCVINVQGHFPSCFNGFRGFIPFGRCMSGLHLCGRPGVLLLQVSVCRVQALIPLLIPRCLQGCNCVCVPPAAVEERRYTAVVVGGNIRAESAQFLSRYGGVEQRWSIRRLRVAFWMLCWR